MQEKYLDKNPVCGERVMIHDMGLVIGDVHLGDDCSVWPYAVIRGDVNEIHCGARTNIQDHSVLHVTHKNEKNPDGFALTIGDDVTIGHRVTCHGCQIGNRVLLGIGSVVLDNVVIDDDVMLGANTLVPPGKHLLSGYLYLGAPAKQVRRLTSEEVDFLKYSAEHYVRLKENYLA